MNKEVLMSHLKSKEMGRTCVAFEETDSTNVQADRLALEGAPHGTLVVADAQTAGRGRRGRTWVSKAGTNIYMSLMLRPEIAPEHASMLTLVMGLSTARACSELVSGHGEIGIKWPNDLVWDGRKICGILTEMRMDGNKVDHVVIGVGINVNGTDFPPELRETAASLCMLTGEPLCREALTARIMELFERDYELFLRTEDLSGLLEDYNRFLVNRNREVRVLDPQKEYTGVARGINELGELLVECGGQIKTVYAGEVSVRGIYGYV